MMAFLVSYNTLKSFKLKNWENPLFSGPSFWGLINPDWSLCNIGMRQSPIDIKPQSVLYDPRLKELLIGEAKVYLFLYFNHECVGRS